MHPHSFVTLFEAINPGEAYISSDCYGGLFERRFTCEASLWDGEPVVAHGVSPEACAINALEDPRVWAKLRINGEVEPIEEYLLRECT